MIPPAVLDSSLFFAMERARLLDERLPDQVAVAVATLAELEVGVLVARDADAPAQRLAT